MVFDETLHRFVDSYLRLAPRRVDGTARILAANRITTPLEQDLYRSVLRLLLRLAANEEPATGPSSTHGFINPATYADIIYENWLIDIPKLLDVAAVYGAANAPLVTRIHSAIFALQPKYLADLRDNLHSITHVVFPMIASRCSVLGLRTTAGPGGARDLTEPQVLDIQSYMADVCSTLATFIACSPSVGAVVVDTRLLIDVGRLYEGSVGALEAYWTRRTAAVKTDARALDRIAQSQVACEQARAALLTLAEACLRAMAAPTAAARGDGGSRGRQATCGEILTDALVLRTFVDAWCAALPVRDVVDGILAVSGCVL